MIGGSIVRALSQADIVVAGHDASATTRAAAQRAGIEILEPVEVAAGADVLFVAVPPAHTASVVATHLLANPGLIVADVASVKQPIVDEVARHVGSGVERFVPSHPLAGATGTGWQHSRADLLEGAAWAVCRSTPSQSLEPQLAVTSVIDRFSSRLVFIDAPSHDLAVASTSHAPHAVAQALVHALAATPVAKPGAILSGGAFRDMTRVAASSPDLWTEILRMNSEATLAAIDELTSALGSIREDIAQGRWEHVGDSWRAGVGLRDAAFALRWESLEWSPASIPADWQALIEICETGHPVRNLRLEDGQLSLEVGTVEAAG